MKKSILYLLVSLLLVSFAHAGVWNNGSYTFLDSGDRTLNGVAMSVNATDIFDHGFSGGWSLHPEYSDTNVINGSWSIRTKVETTASTGMIMFHDPDNGTWTGLVIIDTSYPVSSANYMSRLEIQNAVHGNPYEFGIRPATTHEWHCDGLNTCDTNPASNGWIAYGYNTSNHIVLNFSATDVYAYLNGHLIDTQGWSGGLGLVSYTTFLQGGGDGLDIMVDNFRICNTQVEADCPNTLSTPVVPTIQFITPPTPNASRNNTQATINTTTQAGGRFNLYFDANNPPTTLVLDNVTSGTPYTTNVTVFDDYFFFAENTLNTSVNTSVLNWTFDNVAPIVTNVGDTTGIANTTVTRIITVHDPHLFSGNVSCDVGVYDFLNQSLEPVTNLTLNLTFKLNQTTSCDYEFCDGHTATNIRHRYHVAQNTTDEIRVRWDNEKEHRISVARTGVQATINYTENDDRVSFTVDPVSAGLVVLRYRSTPHAVYMGSDAEFLGWIVNPHHKTWFDMENDDGIDSVNVFRSNPAHFELSYMSDGSPATFHSTGLLNCVSGSFTTTPVDPPTTRDKFIKPLNCQKNTLQDVLFYMFMFVLLVSLYVICKMWVRVAIINILPLVGWFMYGMSLMGCWEFIGVTLCGISLAIILLETITAFTGD